MPNLIPTIPVGDLDRYGNKELLRLVAPLRGFDGEQVAEQVETLLGEFGSAAPLNAADSLVLQGFGHSLREVVRLLDQAEAPVTDDELVFRMFPLNSIPAVDAERQIQVLFGLTTNPYAASRAREYGRDRRRDDDDDDDRPTAPTPLMANLALNMKISSFPRTNCLLVTATQSAVNLVEEIIETIDVAPGRGEFAAFDDSTPVFRVYTLNNADEDDVAETIDAVIPGVVINEDGSNNSVHVLATAREHQEIETLVRTIDTGGEGGGVERITLRYSDPFEMSDLLNALFENEDRDERPAITPDMRTNSIVVRASGGQMEQIQNMLAAYDEGPTATSRNVDGRLRRIPLPAGDAESVARAIKELLGDESRNGNPIRVVIPSEESDEEPQPSAEEDESSTRQRIRREAVQQRSDRLPTRLAGRSDTETLPSGGTTRRVRPVSQSMLVVNVDDGPPGEESSHLSRQRITIEVRDGELLVYSNDQGALDQVEETIRELVRQFPGRNEWTVFYLRAAAAETAATQLVQLLRSNQVPPTGPATVTAYGVSTLQIIPDKRTNALFVSGPQAQVDAAENFLEFLDRTELPESLRDRIPRSIPVRHASVEAIAEMVRELYKDYLEDPNERLRESRRNGGNNDEERQIQIIPDTSAEGVRPPGIRLTVAVDTQASELLVSCNETLFEQIRELVTERDQVAYDLRPSIRVIGLRETTPQQVLAPLGRLLPRVTVSSTSITPRVPASPDRNFFSRDNGEARDRATDFRERGEGRRERD